MGAFSDIPFDFRRVIATSRTIAITAMVMVLAMQAVAWAIEWIEQDRWDFQKVKVQLALP
ncbi:MAG TPA: hypothetical protein ENL03_02155 [Phycisphaerae bacterium]|nr:hypothetical protein [Phycisphaerae bacterium]